MDPEERTQLLELVNELHANYDSLIAWLVKGDMAEVDRREKKIDEIFKTLRSRLGGPHEEPKV
jgi:predicted translin family RNA/ssDNA-binding protein